MNVNYFASLTIEEKKRFVRTTALEIGPDYLESWECWANDEQHPPEGDWHSWLFLGGRGAGKTRAGAEWLNGLMTKGVRAALVGASLHDVREVVIEGPSGLRTIADARNRPYFEVSRRRLVWPKGGVAYAFSAEDVESLRGPQFHYGWADEFCAWRKPSDMLAQLRLGLRLGAKPRLCVTTTPKPIRALKALMAEPGIAVTRGATERNAIGLSEDFLQSLRALYGGTRLAAQELEGLIVDNDTQSLWRAADLMACYGARPPAFDDVIVALDPPATAGGDACGIIVAGRAGERAYVLEDATVSGLSPLGWAQRVSQLVRAHKASRVVAEANQGGEMIRSMLALAGCEVMIELVHARVGKRARAEPVAALYEQGRVVHAPEAGVRFAALEEELMALGSEDMRHSPDRADALVWAVTALMIRGRSEPRVRVL